MSDVTIRSLQLKTLEILLYFDKFCREHNLKYYLAGGCLIGVVRHKGFIPWDDDVDLFMPRPDYERLRELWQKYADSKYCYCRTDKTHNDHHAVVDIRDRTTTFIIRHSVNEDICQGIGIEVIPIDGCPKSKIKRVWQLFNAFMFSLFNVQRLPDNKGGFLRVITGIIYKLVPSQNLRYKLWSFAERQMTKYKWEDCEEVTELIGAIHGMLLRHPKTDFDNVVYKEFEGHQLPVMAGYERYLRLIWGDYMQLPPKEKRVAKHDTVYISTTEPYEKFKGVYYCVSEHKDK